MTLIIERKVNFIYKDNKETYIEGHRGCKYEPENTILAFEKAYSIGCDSFECDIWLSKDLQIVIVHGDEEGKILDKSQVKSNPK